MVRKQNIVIVGGGFGGVKSAMLLTKLKNVNVTLVSDRASFWYFPTMYRTATGAPEDFSSIDLQALFKNREIKIIIDKATSIDQKNKKITLNNKQSLSYDYAIFALGVVTNYFGIEGLKEFSYGVKSIDEASKLKHHIHKQLIEDGVPDLHYVVVGGGPTGIETAGQLKLFIKHISDRHKLPKRKIQVDLIETAPSLLPRMHKSVGRLVARRLRHLGVKLYLNTTVKGETANQLILNNKVLDTETVIWTAGQANNPFFKNNHFSLTERGKVIIDNHLQAQKDIYVIGDNADTLYSGFAQNALFDAQFIVNDINNQILDQTRKNYKPKKPISIIPVGDKWAFVEWGSFRFYGRIGWLLREAADMVGFLDISDPIKASNQWLKGLELDYSCSTCE